MTAAHVLAVRCHWCTRQFPPHRIHQLASGQFICDYCLDWHSHAMEFLGGAMPRGCQECGATWEFMRSSAPGVDIRMYVVPKDGILQLLCEGCKDVFVTKKRHLYENTQFGRNVLNL